MALDLGVESPFTTFSLFGRRRTVESDKTSVTNKTVIKNYYKNYIYKTRSKGEDDDLAVVKGGEVIPSSESLENQNPISGSFSTTQFAGTAVEDATVGNTDWGGESNVFTDNGVVATSPSTGTMLINETTKRLKCTNFSFSLPTGAVIRGIKIIK